jgi:hypothetical protein
MLSFTIGGHWLPQYLYVYDASDNLIVPNIIKFENLKNDFDSLMQKNNLGARLNRHERKGTHIFKISDISPINKILIQQVYSLDFERFGYDF